MCVLMYVFLVLCILRLCGNLFEFTFLYLKLMMRSVSITVMTRDIRAADDVKDDFLHFVIKKWCLCESDLWPAKIKLMDDVAIIQEVSFDVKSSFQRDSKRQPTHFKHKCQC